MSNNELQKAIALINVRPDLGAKHAREALAQDPECSRAHAILSLCLLNLKQPQAALTEAREAVQDCADDAFNFYCLARCHFDLDQSLEAEVAIDEAIMLDPFNAEYLWVLALIQLSSSDFEGTLETAERGLSIDPQHTNCHNIRAYALGKLGKTKESDQAADKALALEPDDALTHAMRGWTLIERHEHEQSLPHFREALRISPDCEWARQGFIAAMPSRHWVFKLHKMLRNRTFIAILLLWLIGNIVYSQGVDSSSKITAVAGVVTSWIFMLLFAFLIFLPDNTICGPVLKFFLQFDPDSKRLLTSDEHKLNNHAVFFITACVLSLVSGMVLHLWYPLGIVIVLFFFSRPLFITADLRTRKCWGVHLAGAAIVGLIIWLISCTGERVLVGALRCAFVFNAIKVVAAGSGAKMLGGAAAGVGYAVVSAREKKKQAMRKRMLGQSE